MQDRNSIHGKPQVKSVPRPAGQLASVKTFEKLSGVQKTEKTLAGRSAGFGQKEKEEEEPKVRQNKGVF